MLQLAVWVVSFVLALFLSSPIAGAVFDGLIAEGIKSSLSESLQGSELLSPAEKVETLLDGLPAPISSILENNEGLRDALEEMDEDSAVTADSVAHSVVNKVVRPVTVVLLRFVVFFILFIGLLFVLRFVKKLLKPVSHLPIIRKVDGILGALLGVFKGIIFVLAVVSVIRIVAALSSPDALISQKTVDDTWLVSWISDINPITNMF